MKSFDEFIKEDKDEILNNDLTFDEFLNIIKASCIDDFEMSATQAIEFTILYKDELKSAWENQYTPKEAIASTKIPGTIQKNTITTESNLFAIDDMYENYIEKINTEKNLQNIKSYVNDYFLTFKHTSFSDERIIERVKNNYKQLNKLADKILLEMTYTKDDNDFEVDVLERNDEIIDKIIDEFSFRYKKIKDRYVRPKKITGKTLYKDIQLDVFLSNKDVIRIIYDDSKETDELKIYVNDKLYYHMDYINDIDIMKKAAYIYENFLQRKNFKVLKKTNPFT